MSDAASREEFLAEQLEAQTTNAILYYERAERYKRALQEIADMDYRGNRSRESEIAFRALTEVTT